MINYLKEKRAEFTWWLLGKRIWERPILRVLWTWAAWEPKK